ncbi:MAG: DUF4411 domain-containing protein [Candidatus Kapaibacterium sp.]
MKIIIDTSSLLSLVRYYLPFDKDGVLYDYIKLKYESGEIIVLDRVFDECIRVAGGLVLKKLLYLKDKKLHYNTTNILPDNNFFDLLESKFLNPGIKNILPPAEFENRKNNYLNLEADSKIILLSLKHKEADNLDNLSIVSEETPSNNDKKPFKKIPAICNILYLDFMTLPELLNKYEGINIKFHT